MIRLDPLEVVVEDDGGVATTGVVGSGGHAVGSWEVALDFDGRHASWSVVNRGDRAAPLLSVGLTFGVEAAGPLRMLSHGYQSWSPCWVRTLGVDRDPSQATGSLEVTRGWHHADQRIVAGDQLRSELVTVLADGDGVGCLLGFRRAVEHDATFRLSDASSPRLTAQAWFGGAVLDPGERRDLHGFDVMTGDDAPDLLEAWAEAFGRYNESRAHVPYQVGWCSWYHYFHDVTEADLDANLARSADWPFEVFQLDDGYQAAIGDWLDTNDDFPSTVDAIAARIAEAGRRPGIWLAPFMATPDSAIAGEHPDWLAGHGSGNPLVVHLNPGWGGVTWSLDTTHPAVLRHLESVAGALVDAGFTYLKLDFTYCPSLDGVWADPGRTPAQRVRAGYEAVRRGAGPDTFLLGCGAPLGQAVGLVDGMRIGPDVAPAWEPGPELVGGLGPTQPSTLNAWRNTLTRSFQHRRLWLNDPDCLMLRRAQTEMAPAAIEAWAHAVAASGGMALVSDDLSLLGDRERRMLDEVIAVGREIDAAARSGSPPRCVDLLDTPTPARLEAGAWSLRGDLTTPGASLSRAGSRGG